MANMRLQKRARLSMMALWSVMGVTVVAFFGLTVESESISREVEHVRSDIRKLEPSVKLIQATQKDCDALEPKLDTLETAQVTCTKWEQVLTHFKTQTPKGSWLTALHGNSSDPTKAINLIIEGKGAMQNTVAEFILRAQKSVALENVNLRYTEERQDRDVKTINFEIGADLKDTLPPKPKDPTPAPGAKT